MTLVRDDIDPAKTWVISDTHFGHQNIIGFCHRPSDHDSLIQENWAEAVGPDDTVIHLGDLCYKGNASFKHLIAPRLTGARKLLILGNHDRNTYGFYKKCGFKLARPFSIMWGSTEVSFSHYPWNERGDAGFKVEPEGPMPVNAWRLHGHIHNSGYTRSAFVPFLAQHTNLSVEQTKYRPVNLALLLAAQLDGRYPADNPTPDEVEKVSHHV
jgi:calcineurin-like phosphoesterase family protein